MDPILYWNDVALQANLVSHTNGKNEQTGPPLSSRALAVVHLAMYDAFAGVSRDPVNLPPYLPGLTAQPGAALWEMIEENGRSRVYLGVHWVFDAFAVKNNGEPDLAQNRGGVRLGLTIAEDIFKNKMAKSKVSSIE